MAISNTSKLAPYQVYKSTTSKQYKAWLAMPPLNTAIAVGPQKTKVLTSQQAAFVLFTPNGYEPIDLGRLSRNFVWDSTSQPITKDSLQAKLKNGTLPWELVRNVSKDSVLAKLLPGAPYMFELAPGAKSATRYKVSAAAFVTMFDLSTFKGVKEALGVSEIELDKPAEFKKPASAPAPAPAPVSASAPTFDIDPWVKKLLERGKVPATTFAACLGNLVKRMLKNAERMDDFVLKLQTITGDKSQIVIGFAATWKAETMALQLGAKASTPLEFFFGGGLSEVNADSTFDRRFPGNDIVICHRIMAFLAARAAANTEQSDSITLYDLLTKTIDKWNTQTSKGGEFAAFSALKLTFESDTSNNRIQTKYLGDKALGNASLIAAHRNGVYKLFPIFSSNDETVASVDTGTDTDVGADFLRKFCADNPTALFGEYSSPKELVTALIKGLQTLYNASSKATKATRDAAPPMFKLLGKGSADGETLYVLETAATGNRMTVTRDKLIELIDAGKLGKGITAQKQNPGTPQERRVIRGIKMGDLADMSADVAGSSAVGGSGAKWRIIGRKDDNSTVVLQSLKGKKLGSANIYWKEFDERAARGEFEGVTVDEDGVILGFEFNSLPLISEDTKDEHEKNKEHLTRLRANLDAFVADWNTVGRNKIKVVRVKPETVGSIGEFAVKAESVGNKMFGGSSVNTVMLKGADGVPVFDYKLVFGDKSNYGGGFFGQFIQAPLSDIGRPMLFNDLVTRGEVQATTPWATTRAVLNYLIIEFAKTKGAKTAKEEDEPTLGTKLSGAGALAQVDAALQRASDAVNSLGADDMADAKEKFGTKYANDIEMMDNGWEHLLWCKAQVEADKGVSTYDISKALEYVEAYAGFILKAEGTQSATAPTANVPTISSDDAFDDISDADMLGEANSAVADGSVAFDETANTAGVVEEVTADIPEEVPAESPADVPVDDDPFHDSGLDIIGTFTDMGGVRVNGETI
jgi:hypothetical protein